MKKVLYCASTVSHIKNFHLPYLKTFKEANYQVWVGVNEKKEIPFSDFVVPFSFRKKMLSLANLIAILSVWKLIRREKFDIVSTHTTLASIIVRLAIKLLPKSKRPQVFHTSHGYLFDDNSRFKKLLYLIPEKLCSSVTNVLMVMNQEDLSIAEKYKLYRDNVYWIDGMGIPPNRFFPVSGTQKGVLRGQKGFSEGDFLIIYAAEFSNRKNHLFLIQSFIQIIMKNIPNAKLLLAGKGQTQQRCREYVDEHHSNNQVIFLDHVADMPEYYQMCDVSVSVSKCEGLPFNVMESMASGIPVICSDIKGHRELVDHEESGLLFSVDSYSELGEGIFNLYSDPKSKKRYIEKGLLKISKYKLEEASKLIFDIYNINPKGVMSGEG